MLLSFDQGMPLPSPDAKAEPYRKKIEELQKELKDANLKISAISRKCEEQEIEILKHKKTVKKYRKTIFELLSKYKLMAHPINIRLAADLKSSILINRKRRFKYPVS